MTWRTDCLSNMQMTPSLGRVVNMQPGCHQTSNLDRLKEQLKKNLLKFNNEKCKEVQRLEQNNPLQLQKLGSCSTEKATWTQMDRELHKPAVCPSSNKGHQHPRLHDQGTACRLREVVVLPSSALVSPNPYPLLDPIIKERH